MGALEVVSVALEGAPQTSILKAIEDAQEVTFGGVLESAFASAIEGALEGTFESTPKRAL